MWGLKMGKVIAIVSGKGGTGKTFFTSNLGTYLAMQGKKVVMIDMDFGMRNLDLYMGMENNVVYNVMDVLSGVCGIKRALIEDKRIPNLFLMSSALCGDTRDVTELHMKVLCDILKKHFDYILIDAPAGVGEYFNVACAGAEKAIIITEAEMASIRDAQVVESQLRAAGVKDMYCVVNKLKQELATVNIVPKIQEIKDKLNVPIAGAIQFDTNVCISTNSGKPIVHKKEQYIYKNFSNIATRIFK